MGRVTLLLSLLLLCNFPLNGQDSLAKKAIQPFIQGELRAAKGVQPDDAPSVKMQVHGSLSFGRAHIDPENPQAALLRFPTTGLQLTYSNFGADDYLGHGVSLLPFLEIPINKNRTRALSWRLGLGVGFINKTYHPEDNPENLAIGSNLNWNFEMFLQYRIPTGTRSGLHIGAGLIHYSNGHTELPNLGLNAFGATVAYRWRELPEDYEPINLRKRKKPGRSYRLFLDARFGYGLHEYGGRVFPIGGIDKNVFATALTFGCTFRQAIRGKLVLGYRHYQAYFDEIKADGEIKNGLEQTLEAGNIYLGIGTEVLMGHVGMDLEGGVNLYKPYYRKQWESFEAGKESDTWYVIKRTLLFRAGLRGYLISTRKSPKHNVYLGAHINTNFDQADFSELSLGYVVQLGKGWPKETQL